MYLKGDGYETVNYIQMAEMQWQTLMNMVTSICIPQKADHFWIN
jgi:hypothetical protein